jgi:phage terminase large subunit
VNLLDYAPRSVFLPFHSRSARWTTIVAHRRAGKTVAIAADLVAGALECQYPKPQFAYLAPFREQAKKVAWSYLKDMSRPWWVKEPNESELFVTMRSHTGEAAKIYVAGADNPDALRGMYFDGCALDEVGDMRPTAWYSVLRPALSDRRGWAVFCGTPRGKNLFWNLREEARLNPKTHMLLELPASKTGILPEDELRDARAQMTPETYEIEYECSFDAAIPGAYWAKDIGRAYEEGRIDKFDLDKAFPVHVVADLGYTDSCAWWGWQETPDGLRVVDFYERDNEPIGHYIDWLKKRPYKVGQVWLPHDAKAKSLQTGKSIMEQFLKAGITPRLVPELSLQDGIEAARQTLPHCWFDETKTYEGIEHIRAYMREWDERTQTFRNRPKHDQHSHAADAFRYLALCARNVAKNTTRGDKISGPAVRNLHSFSLNDIWDTAPTQSRRIG